MNHWTNNLELLNISYSNRRHISLEAENEHRKKHAHHPAKLQGILPTFLSVFFLFFSCLLVGRWVHNWIISEDFMYALSYIFNDYCFLFSSTFCFHIPDPFSVFQFRLQHTVHKNIIGSLHLHRSCVKYIHLNRFDIFGITTHTAHIETQITSSMFFFLKKNTKFRERLRERKKMWVRFVCKAANWIYLQLSINIIRFPNIWTFSTHVDDDEDDDVRVALLALVQNIGFNSYKWL